MTTALGPLASQVGALVGQAAQAFAGLPEQGQLTDLSSRIGEPLRVAIAGKVKAGKSTLLNALVGERLAPTDAGECTTIVTWYRDGTTYRVTMHQPEGVARQLRFRREDNALDIDLAGTPAESVAYLEVEWPSAALNDITLIDTPGIDSISTDLAARTEGFLTPDAGPSVTDAVLYMMRHLHEHDVRFLESFHDQVASQPSAINAIGILSRADEIGVGRLDAMGSAKRIASRYSTDPKIRRLCQTVVPVAGLLAESGATLRQEEFRLLQLLADADRGVL
ncbi:MAG: dynamin family protein, partial [Actinomycetota bacterium]|nr:dynamin family protein [Actinomycetota bacterium]